MNARAPARSSRPRVVLVAACAQRKRLPVSSELSLSSLEGPVDQRAREWCRRLARVSAPYASAYDLYAGDHWHAVMDAYRLAVKYSSRTELWVISAGYGLIPAVKQIKSYSATFAVGDPDSVWRGPIDGERRARLQHWWHDLGHDASLEELLPGRGGALLIAAGTAYLTAIDGDLDRLLAAAANEETVSVVSAGTRGNGPLLPVSGALRGVLGGTDSALNARTLRLLAATAAEHGFRRSEMKRVLERLARSAKSTVRGRGRTASDSAIRKEIRHRRRNEPGISRSRALREIRGDGIACEQDRFAVIWASVAAQR